MEKSTQDSRFPSRIDPSDTRNEIQAWVGGKFTGQDQSRSLTKTPDDALLLVAPDCNRQEMPILVSASHLPFGHWFTQTDPKVTPFPGQRQGHQHNLSGLVRSTTGYFNLPGTVGGEHWDCLRLKEWLSQVAGSIGLLERRMAAWLKISTEIQLLVELNPPIWTTPILEDRLNSAYPRPGMRTACSTSYGKLSDLFTGDGPKCRDMLTICPVKK